MRRAIVTGLLFALACGGAEAPPPSPTVATAEPVRGGFAIEREGYTWNVRGPVRVENEAAAITAEDGRGALQLDGGGWVLLDRQSRATLTLEALTLQTGRVWVDARDVEVRVQTEEGELRGVDATFAVDRTGEGTEVYCGSGEVAWVAGGEDGRLAQGETLAMRGGGAEVAPAELWNDWTGGLADPTPRHEAVPGYVGVLAGRALHELGKARRPLSLRAHEVDASVRGDLAETEVVQTFFNAESQALEAEYRMRVPEGAIVAGFAVDLGGGWVEGEIRPLATSGYALSWAPSSAETSRLSYDGPGRLRARVHPIGPGQTVRVKVRYVEWLDREGDMRSYAYPMVTEGAAPPLVGELRLRLDASEANVGAFRAGMGARVEEQAVIVRRSDYRPLADFVVDLVDPEEVERAEGAAAYVVDAPDAAPGQEAADGDERFVLFDVPTSEIVAELEEDAWEDPGLDLVVVVDASGATEAEDLELARAVVETVLQQLAPSDRVALRVGDVTARAPEGTDAGLQPATDETREALLGALAEVPLGGATDLAAVLRDAADVVAGKPRGAVLYVGDAIPTTGSMDTPAIRRALATLEDAPRFFGLAAGEGANLDLLRALFGEDQAFAVAERTEASRTVMRLLADAARPMLRNVEVDLGPAVERVYPRPPISVAEGAPLRLVGRRRADLPTEIEVRGTRDARPFELTMKVHAEALEDGGDIRRRWASARLQELLAEDAGREALVELGVRFGVLTPWTSFVAVGGKVEGSYPPVRGFDVDPRTIDWALGGGAASRRMPERGGWRRRVPEASAEEAPAVAVERTWVSRVRDVADAGGGSGDGGLARAAVSRALSRGTRGPNACFERRLTVRPDLRGNVAVEVEVEGDGTVKDAKLLSSSLGAADVDACILTEVRGLRFPATGGATVSVTHTYRFDGGGRAIGVRRQCSDASRQSLEVRAGLWRERLAANAGVRGALSVWREAQRQCELSSWRARRTLLDRMIRHVGGVPGQVRLYQALAGNAAIARYLRRAILRNVRTPRDVVAVRAGLGLDAPVDWDVFARLWKRNDDPAARLRLVRRWLEVLPEEMDLRLRLLALLEETGALAEAKRVARELRADPLADARVRTAVGEFWLRQEDEAEARRVFSELVERTPYDPWARRRLGDLYRAHGWYDDAYREYGALARLRPDDPAVLLMLARAAAGAGRVDEALRLEQRLGESVEEGAQGGAAGVARLWSTVRLAALKGEADAATRAMIRRRERQTGVLREPPAVLAALTWAHPEDRPELHVKLPSTPEDVEWERAEVQAAAHGMEAQAVPQRAEGEALRFEVRRVEEDALRDLEATLTVIVGLGSEGERVHRVPLVLDRETRKATFVLEGGELRRE